MAGCFSRAEQMMGRGAFLPVRLSMFVVLHLLGSSADQRLSALSCSIPLLLVLSASELCVCGDACPILLLLGDGYLPGRQVGLCARKR